MTDARVLLERHKPAPRLRLPGGILRRLRGDLDGLADATSSSARTGRCSPSRRSSRSASSVRTRTPTARQALATDMIGDTTRNYANNAAALHKHAKYAQPRPRPRPPGRPGPPVAPVLALLLLQRLPAARPALAAATTRATGSSCSSGSTPPSSPSRSSSPSTRRPRARPWKDAPSQARHAARLRRPRLARELLRQGHALDRQLVRPGRRQGPADHADARRPRGRRARRGCCGRASGATRRPASCRWTPPARSARACAPHWLDPSMLTRRGPEAGAPAPPAAAADATRAAHAGERPRRRALRRAAGRDRAGRRAAAKGSRRARRHPAPSRSTRPRARSSSPRTTATTTSGRASSAPDGVASEGAARARACRRSGSAGVAHARRDPGDRGQQRRARLLAARAHAAQELDLEVRERVDPRVAVLEPALQRGRLVQQPPLVGDVSTRSTTLSYSVDEVGPEALARCPRRPATGSARRRPGRT